MFRIKAVKICALALIGAVLFMPSLSFAQMQVASGASDIGTIFNNLTNNARGVGGFVEAFAYVAAFVFGVVSLFLFKANRDNPQQTPLSKPAIVLIVAILLAALPTLIGSGQSTIWGSGTVTNVQPW